jgi:hypothetical protein
MPQPERFERRNSQKTEHIGPAPAPRRLARLAVAAPSHNSDIANQLQPFEGLSAISFGPNHRCWNPRHNGAIGGRIHEGV